MTDKERLKKIVEFSRQEIARKPTKFNAEYFTGEPQSDLISLSDLEWAIVQLADQRNTMMEAIADAINEFADSLDRALIQK